MTVVTKNKEQSNVTGECQGHFSPPTPTDEARLKNPTVVTCIFKINLICAVYQCTRFKNYVKKCFHVSKILYIAHKKTFLYSTI